MTTITELEPVQRLAKDLKQASLYLSDVEARYLIDYYYQQQKDRLRAGNRLESMSKEPHDTIKWLFDNNYILEKEIRKVLAIYAQSKPTGRWALTITGIGPVITAGLLAHIDITKAPTVGRIWRYAGLDPTVKWEKGQKRPWNAQLKTLCWKIGECFWKFQNKEGDFYGGLAARRKEYEIERNERGDNKEIAAAILSSKSFRKNTEAYKAYSIGKLPDGQIHERAKRWAVKIFLAHYHHVAYYFHYGSIPPKPYALSILGHGHEIEIPNWPM